MKREEKNIQSRQKIIAAALQEFGDKSYAEASLNTVCKSGDISKGIIYHYFKDKDELFLVCLKECFDALTAHLKNHTAGAAEEGSIENTMRRYFDARTRFFMENPLYLKLFFHAVITPPAHLSEQIQSIRKEFDELNVNVLTSLLQNVKLRSDITMEEIVEEFRLYQDIVNTRYQMQAASQVDMEEHERRCRRTLSILLYGVIDREGDK